jgi:hypothetical protein
MHNALSLSTVEIVAAPPGIAAGTLSKTAISNGRNIVLIVLHVLLATLM